MRPFQQYLLLSAAKNLYNQIMYVHKSEEYADVWLSYELSGKKYTGPHYSDQLDELEIALREQPPIGNSILNGPHLDMNVHNCYYCGTVTSSLFSDYRSIVWLPHKEEPGKMKPHCMDCITKRLEKADGQKKN